MSAYGYGICVGAVSRPLVMVCEKQQELRQRATECLDQIDRLTKEQLAVMREEDGFERLMELDKELEMAFGAKERAFGALFQHRDDHGC